MKKIIIADSLKDFIEQHVSLIAGYDNKVFFGSFSFQVGNFPLP